MNIKRVKLPFNDEDVKFLENTCFYGWTQYSVLHLCYRDKGHDGQHMCGPCEDDSTHEFTVTIDTHPLFNNGE